MLKSMIVVATTFLFALPAMAFLNSPGSELNPSYFVVCVSQPNSDELAFQSAVAKVASSDVGVIAESLEKARSIVGTYDLKGWTDLKITDVGYYTESKILEPKPLGPRKVCIIKTGEPTLH